MPTLIPEDVQQAIVRMEAERCPYVLATVVWTSGLSSGKPGSRAVITPDGVLRGWVGGACTLGAVVRTAQDALSTDTPVVLRVGPEAALQSAPSSSPNGTRRTHVSHCASEGVYEVFIEPRRPRPQLVVFGDTPIAATLCKLARVVDFDVVAVVKGPAERPDAHRVVQGPDLDGVQVDANTYLVVATMGQWDTAALGVAASSDADFVSLVASRKRWARLRERLSSRVSADKLDRVRAPGGLDLGAVPHTEIAVSLLAEVVAHKARVHGTAATETQVA